MLSARSLDREIVRKCYEEFYLVSSLVTYQRNAAKKMMPSTDDPRSHNVGEGRAYHNNPLSANQRTELKMASRCLIRHEQSKPTISPRARPCLGNARENSRESEAAEPSRPRKAVLF
jgi:hypothetical protein